MGKKHRRQRRVPNHKLGIIGHLDLLRRLYDKVVIPDAVYREIAVLGAGEPGADEIRSAAWVEVRQVNDRSLCASWDLGPGEAEAIALAIELHADIVLMDERRGRSVGSRLGLRIVGLLGVLVEAQKKGLAPKLRPLLDELVAKAGFRISEQLYSHVLRTVGE